MQKGTSKVLWPHCETMNSHEHQAESTGNQTILFSNTYQRYREVTSPIRMAIVIPAKDEECHQGHREQRTQTLLVGCK